jgi:hypothetical protein
MLHIRSVYSRGKGEIEGPILAKCVTNETVVFWEMFEAFTVLL